MTLRHQVIFWLVVLVGLVLVLWGLGGILLPFVAGMVLAYFLDPVADWLEDHNIPRLAATVMIVGLFVLIFVLILIFLLPVLVDQIGAFARELPAYVQNIVKLINNAAPEWLLKEIESRGIDMQGPVSDLATKAAGWLGTVFQSVLSGGLALVNLLALLVVTPIVAFYMLNDWDRMIAKVDSWVPREHVGTVRQLADDADHAIAGFIRGQGTVCITLGIVYAIALTIVGLNFGLLIGLGAGLFSFIPYVGAILGGLASVGMALVQFWPDWTMVAVVAGIFAAGQFLEGNFLTPKLVGDNVGLHPVWLMFALFAAGYLFGFVGMLLAVPVAAAIGVLIRFALEKYMESSVYQGSGDKKYVFAPIATSRAKRLAAARSEKNDETDEA
ncbi:MAG: AI-2E family transporter [Alphaproteobacteria bacterium]|nr:AI-2E family transporter [Alphaproteobacteria bacterium]